jgi:hypothetical protein
MDLGYSVSQNSIRYPHGLRVLLLYPNISRYSGSILYHLLHILPLKSCFYSKNSPQRWWVQNGQLFYATCQIQPRPPAVAVHKPTFACRFCVRKNYLGRFPILKYPSQISRSSAQLLGAPQIILCPHWNLMFLCVPAVPAIEAWLRVLSRFPH